MIPIVESALSLSIEVFKLINSSTTRKYIDAITKLRLELLQEEAKQDQANDSKCERLEAELKINMDAAREQIMLEISKK